MQESFGLIMKTFAHILINKFDSQYTACASVSGNFLRFGFPVVAFTKKGSSWTLHVFFSFTVCTF